MDTGCWPSRFVVYSYTNPDEDSDGEIEAMTAANCDTENWAADRNDYDSSDPFRWLIKALSAWIKWIRVLFNKIFRRG